jgi:hypothetical protein
MDYLAWNDAIGARFFNPDRSGVRVFFYVTTDVVNEIGAPDNADLEDFLAALKTGPPWNTRHGRGICQQALQALEDWRARGLDYPPYLNYLALFVVADTVDVGFARHAYYPGLRHLLAEEPETGMYPSFNLMYRLWDDLAVWSNQDRHGEWGVFNADIVGEWMHVGLPRAQTLLTDEERENLPFLFADNGLDPHSPPSEGELSYLLAADPHHHLRPHTKELLRSTREGDASIRVALVEALLDDLEHWDGTVPARPEAGEQVRSSLGNLRLAMTLDRTAKTVHFCLRCRSNREYPEEGLQLVREDGAEPLYCYGDWQGWSTPLYDTETQMRIFDASRMDWRAGLSLADREHAWRTSLSKRSVRVMVSASPFGFDGFVEESQIPHGKPFYLLANNEHAETLQAWGRDCCTGFEVEAVSGMPHGWHLYSVERANADAIIRDAFPFLAFPTVLRIQLRGGLKVRGSQYFSFALPHVEVTGANDTVQMFCNDRPLQQHPETGLFSIPDDVCARRIIVEVRRDGECIRRRSLYSLETLAWRYTTTTTHLDKFGRRIDGEAAESCVGSIVDGVAAPEFNPEVFLPPSDGHRVYFIGRNPGEIVECPSDTMPDAWKPVWAVSMKKKGKGNAVYCGADPSDEEPTQIRCADHRRWRLWQDVLWYKRKQISFPSHPALRALWKKYKEAARRVR